MNSVKKAFFIMRTQGFRVFARRAFERILSEARAIRDRRRRVRDWRKAVRLDAPTEPLRILTSGVQAPDVSIIIPIYGQDLFTYNCLRAIADHLEEDISVEIIVIDDGSPSATQALLASIEGIRSIRNDQNSGYIACCNRGAAFATGELLVFLNNDTLVQKGWLSALVHRKRADPTIGGVGSKLLYPDRTLAESGAIIWRDGSGWNFGRGCDEDDPAYNYLRDADYCSSASLLVDRKQFLDLGGFDTRYSPAYYEDVDLCFTLRSHGLRTVVEPRSVVVHFEGVTGGIDERSGAKRFQRGNRERFAKKWAQKLQEHAAPAAANVRVAARRLSGRPRVLAIDSFVPFDDRDAGSLRLLRLLVLMRELGCDLTFYPHDGTAHEPYASRLRDQGIEVLCKTRRLGAAAHLRERLGIFDIAWICRPELAAIYAPLFRSQRCQVYFDTVDLHFVRLEREEQVTGRRTGWQRMRQLEIRLAKGADATIVTSPVERGLLLAEGVSNVHVIPPVQPEAQRCAPWAERADVLFIGNYTHAPNVDAAIYLARTIFPLMTQAVRGLRLLLVGNEPPPAVLALGSDSICVTGHVAHLEPFLQRARVFVAPLRFGSGIKGKILQSMAYGLPTVTTPIGAEGLGLEHGVNALIADSPSELAGYAIDLYERPQRWDQISRAAVKHAARYTPGAVRSDLSRLLAVADHQAFSSSFAK